MGISSVFIQHHELFLFHCNHFLSNRKQSTVSKITQEMNTEEGLAETKPRSVCLVSRKLLSVKQKTFSENEVVEKLVRDIKNELAKTKSNCHILQISDSLFFEKVFKNLRQKLNPSEKNQMIDLKTDVLISGLLVSTMMKASVRLGPNCNESSDAHRKTIFEARRCSTSRTCLILEHDD